MNEKMGERPEWFSGKQETEWDELKEVPFAGAEEDAFYENLMQEHREAYEKKVKAEKETRLHSQISMDALLRDVDEPVVREARLIDNLGFAPVGQEAMIDEKREEAIKRYKSLNDRRVAERRVLEEMSGDLIGDDGRWWKREDIIDDLDWWADNARKNKEEGWSATVQACQRLKGRLEKFDPDLAGELERDDMEYWDKLTKAPEKMFSDEELRPKIISAEEVSMLFGEDDEHDSDKKAEKFAHNEG